MAECILEAVKDSPFILSIRGLDSGTDDAAAELTFNRINYYLRFNQGGRHLVEVSPPPLAELWPTVLARSSEYPDVLYHLLRAKPDMGVASATSGLKREATGPSDLD